MPGAAASNDRTETAACSSSLRAGVSDSFAVYAARRALTAVLVAITLSAVTFLMLRVLTPESFPDPRGLHVELADYLVDVFVHADFGVSALATLRSAFLRLLCARASGDGSGVSGLRAGIVLPTRFPAARNRLARRARP